MNNEMYSYDNNNNNNVNRVHICVGCGSIINFGRKYCDECKKYMEIMQYRSNAAITFAVYMFVYIFDCCCCNLFF